MNVRSIIPILGDQLSPSISSLRDADPNKDVILMAEVDDEASYVRHHKKKIAFLFSAMRHFAKEMRDTGWRVEYKTIGDTNNQGSLTDQLADAVQRFTPERIIATLPGEWRLFEQFYRWQEQFSAEVELRDDDRFICTSGEFSDWAKDRKSLRMEFFYREMRRKTGLLMDGEKPVGGKWNYDSENRKPASDDMFMPKPLRFEADEATKDILSLVESRFARHFGDIYPFDLAVTRKDAEAAFDHFVAKALPQFGDFQDAMLTGQPFLYHSVISPYLNCSLLDPLDVCKKVEAAYQSGDVPLNAAEGFIRQVIGWREYVRGIYWLNMPGYGAQNYFDHKRPLPEFYWTGETDMACMKAAVGQTRKYAYAHHIQRLMVTGNFALLAGIDPHALHIWYLTVYFDAYEWVELPNTIGMSQFADGGMLASKPYISSGAYINRMSDYCAGCKYDVKARHGNNACPFNPLYWNFIDRHRDKLSGNPRMAMMYRSYDKFSSQEKNAISDSAAQILQAIDAEARSDDY